VRRPEEEEATAGWSGCSRKMEREETGAAADPHRAATPPRSCPCRSVRRREAADLRGRGGGQRRPIQRRRLPPLPRPATRRIRGPRVKYADAGRRSRPRVKQAAARRSTRRRAPSPSSPVTRRCHGADRAPGGASSRPPCLGCSSTQARGEARGTAAADRWGGEEEEREREWERGEEAGPRYLLAPVLSASGRRTHPWSEGAGGGGDVVGAGRRRRGGRGRWDEERRESPRGCACGGVLLQNAASLGAPAGGRIVLLRSAFCRCKSIWSTCWRQSNSSRNGPLQATAHTQSLSLSKWASNWSLTHTPSFTAQDHSSKINVNGPPPSIISLVVLGQGLRIISKMLNTNLSKTSACHLSVVMYSILLLLKTKTKKSTQYCS
jgi:hypothetical protein